MVRRCAAFSVGFTICGLITARSRSAYPFTTLNVRIAITRPSSRPGESLDGSSTRQPQLARRSVVHESLSQEALSHHLLWLLFGLSSQFRMTRTSRLTASIRTFQRAKPRVARSRTQDTNVRADSRESTSVIGYMTVLSCVVDADNECEDLRHRRGSRISHIREPRVPGDIVRTLRLIITSSAALSENAEHG